MPSRIRFIALNTWHRILYAPTFGILINPRQKQRQRQKQPKNAFFLFLGCFCPYVGQPHDHLGWATSMPLASNNPTIQGPINEMLGREIVNEIRHFYNAVFVWPQSLALWDAIKNSFYSIKYVASHSLCPNVPDVAKSFQALYTEWTMYLRPIMSP